MILQAHISQSRTNGATRPMSIEAANLSFKMTPGTPSNSSQIARYCNFSRIHYFYVPKFFSSFFLICKIVHSRERAYEIAIRLTKKYSVNLIILSFTLQNNPSRTEIRRTLGDWSTYLSLKFWTILENLSIDSVAEWLRRWTRNPLGSARVGSNPIAVAIVGCVLF